MTGGQLYSWLALQVMLLLELIDHFEKNYLWKSCEQVIKPNVQKQTDIIMHFF